jgi:hypothetical protein
MLLSSPLFRHKLMFSQWGKTWLLLEHKPRNSKPQHKHPISRATNIGKPTSSFSLVSVGFSRSYHSKKAYVLRVIFRRSVYEPAPPTLSLSTRHLTWNAKHDSESFSLSFRDFSTYLPFSIVLDLC